MTKIRHISYRAEDVDAMAKFFIDALGLTMVQKRKDNSIDLSDGSINISILPLAANRSVGAGLDHIGFSAEDNREQIRRVEAVGALKERTRSPYEESLKVPKGSSSTSAAGQARRRQTKSNGEGLLRSVALQ
jgi:catechol 2,3-dioxygenase-like lactoylglutathione lyase family enzyme